MCFLQVFDFKMTDPKLYQILHDNMVNYEPRKVRMGLQVRATNYLMGWAMCSVKLWHL